MKGIARQFGGRWSKQYNNWRFPSGVKAALVSQLESLGAKKLV
jgi:hypothetical protein